MDDLTEKLAQMLNDPETMNRVRQMAEGLLGNQNQENQQAPQQPVQSPPIGGDLLGMLNGDELRSIAAILSSLKSSANDSRAQLLLALKPHLSEPKRAKVDTAIKILRLLDILPLLKESGLFKL